MEISRVGDFSLGWGESLVWDDATRRLYFADCAAQTIHWLDDGRDELHAFKTPSMPAGLVPTSDERLLAMLDDGVHEVDVDAGTTELVTPYPERIGGRCNDACADLDGNLVTGKLNLGPDEGSAWWFCACRRLATARRRHREHQRPGGRCHRRRDDPRHRRHLG